MVRVVGARGISPAFAAQTNLLYTHIHQFDLNDRPLTSRSAQAGLVFQVAMVLVCKQQQELFWH